jgi:hypothetical protein
MTQLTDEKIAELKAKHPTLIMVEAAHDGTALVFRKPTRHEYDRWQDSDKKTKDHRELASSTLVFPENPAEFMAILDRLPGLLTVRGGILDSVCSLAAFEEGAAASKKL